MISYRQNYDEIRSITHLVRLYYRHTNFCIITPYDAQRAAIENELKAQDLPWDRVFNVDSFQGLNHSTVPAYVCLTVIVFFPCQAMKRILC